MFIDGLLGHDSKSLLMPDWRSGCGPASQIAHRSTVTNHQRINNQGSTINNSRERS
jgi:hypothetical protein